MAEGGDEDYFKKLFEGRTCKQNKSNKNDYPQTSKKEPGGLIWAKAVFIKKQQKK